MDTILSKLKSLNKLGDTVLIGWDELQDELNINLPLENIVQDNVEIFENIKHSSLSRKNLPFKELVIECFVKQLETKTERDFFFNMLEEDNYSEWTDLTLKDMADGLTANLDYLKSYFSFNYYLHEHSIKINKAEGRMRKNIYEDYVGFDYQIQIEFIKMVN